jgi:hypothetical protein
MNGNKLWVTWNNLNINWNTINLNWEDLYTLIDIVKGSGASGLVLDSNNVWKSADEELEKKGHDEEKRNKFLKIVVEINGLQKEENRSFEEIKKIITVSHIKKTIAQVAPDVKIEAVNIKRNG